MPRMGEVKSLDVSQHNKGLEPTSQPDLSLAVRLGWAGQNYIIAQGEVNIKENMRTIIILLLYMDIVQISPYYTKHTP